MAEIIVLYRPAGPSALGTQHKDVLLKMDDGSYLRAYNVPDRQETGNWGGHTTIVDRISPELAELYESTYFAHPTEILTSGEEGFLYGLMISVIASLQQISNSDVGYAPLDTNSNWAADKALYQATLPLPQEDDFFENYSPGSIEYSQIPERIADDYGPREGEVDGVISTPSEQEGEQCFLAGTPITMWPIDPSLKPGPNGVYDKAQVRAGLWTKPIEQVSPKDLVLSHDKNGNMVPGYVPQTMVNESKIILDFHGTWVTPGHVYWCAEGKFAKQYAPLIDILRTDGAVQHESGVMVRAATGCEVGSLEDFPVKIIRMRNGQPDMAHPERLRLGARFITTDAKEKTFRDDVEKQLGKLDAKGFFPDGQHISNLTFAWPEEQPWPSPEDYVFIRSQTTLEDIYKVSQWEYMRPQMPAPMVMDGGSIQPLPAHEVEQMKRNTPMAMLGLGQGGSPMAQKTLAGPGGKSPMNRKARKAAEARQRKAAKGRKKVIH